MGARLLAQLTRQRQAALPGQHPVEQNRVRQQRIKFTLRGHAVPSYHRREAAMGEVDSNQLGNRRLIFDNQYARLVFHATTI